MAVEPRPELSELNGVRVAYDAVARDYAKHLPDTRAETSMDLAMVDAFADAVATSSTAARVLDAGCGTGRMSRYLADSHCDVEGVDLSPGMIEMACHFHPDLKFGVGSLNALAYPDNYFDGVLLWYSIIHTPPVDHDRIFAEAGRVLRSGGHILIGTQSGYGVRDVAPAFRRFGHEIELVRYLTTADQIVARLEGVGLRETARMVRVSGGSERDGQTVVLASAP